MADLLRRELGVEVRLIKGSIGELKVLVGDEVAARRRWFRYPSDEQVVARVRELLEKPS